MALKLRFAYAKKVERFAQYYFIRFLFEVVGYSVTEGYGKSYWMLWNSEDIGKAADVPGDDVLVLERFRNAVDICVIYEDRFNQGISSLIAGCFSPFVWIVTVPDIFESWEQAEFAAKKADYFFSLLE